MIDVMMFLLVFFVLISTNVLPALGLKITAPSSATPEKILEKVKFTVGITRSGETYLDGAPVALEALPGLIKTRAENKPVTVIIAGDEGAQVQALVSVLDALKAAGVAGAQIVTRQK